MGIVASAINGHTPDIHLEHMILVLAPSESQNRDLLDSLGEQAGCEQDRMAIAALCRKVAATHD
jgi:hypothetical protein